MIFAAKKKTSKALELWLRMRDLDICGVFGEHVVHEDEHGTLTVRKRHNKITVEVVDETTDTTT